MNNNFSIEHLPTELLNKILQEDKKLGYGDSYSNRLECVSKKFSDIAKISTPSTTPITSKYLKITSNSFFAKISVPKIIEYIHLNQSVNSLEYEEIVCESEYDLKSLVMTLSTLKNLKTLKLSFSTKSNIFFRNETIKLLPLNLPHLEELFINYSHCKDSGFIELLKLPVLKKLTITNSLISFDNNNKIFDQANKNSSLHYLNVSSNTHLKSIYSVVNRYCDSLHTIIKAENVDSPQNIIIDYEITASDFVIFLIKHPSIESLECKKIACNRAATINHCLQALSRNKKLEKLTIGFVSRNFNDLLYLNCQILTKSCPQLKELTLYSSSTAEVSYPQLVELTKLSNLEKLMIRAVSHDASSFVQANNQPSLNLLPSLKSLSFIDCPDLAPEFLRSLAAFPNLEVLELKHTDMGHNLLWGGDDNNPQRNRPFSFLPKLEHLKHLHIPYLSICDCDNIGYFENFHTIEHLYINEPWERLGADRLQNLIQYENLKHLTLLLTKEEEDRNFSEILKLNGMKALETLHLKETVDYEITNSQALNNFLRLNVKKLILDINLEQEFYFPIENFIEFENSTIESIEFRDPHINAIDFRACPNLKELTFYKNHKNFEYKDWLRISTLKNLQSLTFKEKNSTLTIKSVDVLNFVNYKLKTMNYIPNISDITQWPDYKGPKLTLTNQCFNNIPKNLNIKNDSITHLKIKNLITHNFKNYELTFLFQQYFPNLTTFTFHGPVLNLTYNDLNNIKSITNLSKLIFITRDIQTIDDNKYIIDKKKHIIDRDIPSFLDKKINSQLDLLLEDVVENLLGKREKNDLLLTPAKRQR